MVPWDPGIDIPNGISIGSSVFADLTLVTNRQTDRVARVTTGCILSYALRCGLKSKTAIVQGFFHISERESKWEVVNHTRITIVPKYKSN